MKILSILLVFFVELGLKFVNLGLSIAVIFTQYFANAINRITIFCKNKKDNNYSPSESQTGYTVLKYIFLIVFFLPCLLVSLAEFIAMSLLVSSFKIVMFFVGFFPLIGSLVGLICGMVVYIVNSLFSLLFAVFYLPDILYKKLN